VSDAGDTHAPPTAAVDPHAFPPKPPIWRGADQSRVCARRVVLGGTAALVLFGLLGIRSFSWIMRSEIDEPGIPSGVAIVGSDDATGESFMLYFDERGVSRKYDGDNSR